jgi:sec-independent protein translocase protein TatA
MGWDAPWHWIVLAIVVIALFGYKRLPDAARSLGRSLRIFKTEMKGLTDDDAARNSAGEPPASATPAPPATPQVPPTTSQVPPSLGADTHAAVPGAEPAPPAAQAPWETPQQH